MKNAKPDACERVNTYRGTSYAIQTRLNHYNYIDMVVFLRLQPLGNPILLLDLVNMALIKSYERLKELFNRKKDVFPHLLMPA